MEKQEYTVKVVTPTIMGGANSKELDSNYIRTTEIKSAMRQAFRLVAGKYIDHNQKEHYREEGIKLLYKLESEVFGNTEGKGKFRLILDIDPNYIKEGNIKPLPHKSNFTKKAIMPNSKFKLQIISYKYPIEFYKALLDIAFLLGVGFKRNRLFGNMKIEQSESFHFGKSVEKIENFLKERGLEERFTENPLFACLSKRSNGDKNEDKNYLIKSVYLKDEYLTVDEKFEIMLKVLYEKIIHEIEERFNFILGKTNPRQSSYVNFSILEGRSGYMFCILSFYYKNDTFNYDKWLKATDMIKGLVEKTFQR
jgi:CRISPR type III-B/RAMP module RAMP protein Cmr1